MLKSGLIAALCLSAAACSTVPDAGDGAEAPPPAAIVTAPAAPFDWIEGCWQTADGTREVWSPDYQGVRFGYAVTIIDGKRVFFEDMRLEQRGDGWAFVVHPGGADSPTVFPMADEGAASAVFENPDNDYPQRIEYARKGDALVATIALIDGSGPGVFAYAACAAD